MIGLQILFPRCSVQILCKPAVWSLIVFLAWTQQTTPVNAQSLEAIGYVENLWLKPFNASLPAKIDTGARTSSLHAPDYEVFKKKGKKWVRFKLKTKKGKRIEIKRPVERFVRIRRASVEIKRRPIIKLKSCIGGKTKMAEFSLTDRSSMNYQAIIGRAFLSGHFVVNSADAFLASGQCNPGKK